MPRFASHGICPVESIYGAQIAPSALHNAYGKSPAAGRWRDFVPPRRSGFAGATFVRFRAFLWLCGGIAD
ncbi:MAG TPA: hypothetical protein DHV85_23045 [Candidatus Accumulibacter sp.]|nr:hypothetical protein [Accumulibacter sp.]